MLFYSLLGPDASDFKISELEIDVYVRDLGAQKTVKLTIPSGTIEGKRFAPKITIASAAFTMRSKFVLANIKGRVKWRKGTEATLKLALCKADADRSDTELVLAKYAPDKSNDEYTTKYINIKYADKEDFFKPRQEGWSGICIGSANNSLHVFPPSEPLFSTRLFRRCRGTMHRLTEEIQS